MSLMRDKVAKIVVRRAKITDVGIETEVPDYVEQVEYAIKRYCNISEMPEDIVYLWADLVKEVMVADMPNEDFAVDAQGPGNVSIGSFSYSNTKDNVDQAIVNNHSKLNYYRRVRSL